MNKGKSTKDRAKTIDSEGDEPKIEVTKKKEHIVAKKKAAKKKTAKKKVVKKAKKKTTGTKRRGGGLTQMTYALSEPLAVIVGAKTLTRPQIVKKLWVYIKAHKCQDMKNRRMINPDQKLSAVIGKKPVDMLKLATFLNKHITKK